MQEVKIIRSNRKTIAIQVNADLTVTVRAPKRAAKRDIERFLKEKEPWIEKHLEQFRERNARYEAMNIQSLTEDDIKKLDDINSLEVSFSFIITIYKKI